MNGHIFFYHKIKKRVSSRLLAKIRVSQVFWEPIKNRVSPRSVLLEAVYLEALLYYHLMRKGCCVLTSAPNSSRKLFIIVQWHCLSWILQKRI